METPICSQHGTPMTMRPAGLSKTKTNPDGTPKPYEAFWACSDKNPDGSYCKAKPTMAGTPTVPQNSIGDDIREINYKLQLIADALKSQGNVPVIDDSQGNS